MKFTGERFIMGQAVGDIAIEHLQRYQTVAALVRGKNVIDSACGEGYGSYILSKQANRVIGIDISEQAVAYATEKYASDNLTYQCASIEKLPIPDHSIDVVVSFETIEHVNVDLQRIFLTEIKRVLKPDGMLIMSSPDKRVYSDIRNFANPYHVHEMYEDEFKSFLNGYFAHFSFFRQGIDDKRLGVIERLDGTSLDRVRLISDIHMNPDEMQYILAICSDQMLDEELTNQLVSVMPFVLDSPVRVFIDSGEGFNEDNVVVGTVKNDLNVFCVRFDFKDINRIDKLRFDPIEKKGCICKIHQVNSDAKNIEIKALNAFDVLADASERFLNADPQYAIDADFDGATFLEITYQLKEISLDELWKLIQSEYYNERAAKSVAIAEKNHEIAMLDHEIAMRDSRIDNLNTEKAAIENHLQEIYYSRGYRLVRKYYWVRDFILPRGSSRRMLVKNVAKGVLRYKNTLSFVNKNNLLKLMQYIKKGEFRQLLVKVDSKLSSESVQEFIRENDSICYDNDFIKDLTLYDIASNRTFDIVVPIYNAFEFTKKCIESVYMNTDVYYNLYLINDCSTDNRISALLQDLKKQDKPVYLKKFCIIENEVNLGFIKSVNKAMALGENHVVLLNTDTEVPPNWLKRLAIPVFRDDMVASVTPFSNCATICSFPNFCEDNELAKGLTLAEIDFAFARFGADKPIEIPTGVGFCMLMNRKCLQDFGNFDIAYGKGYGEENDWCMRVHKKGYKHVMVTNLFVYHKHGVSFAEHKDKVKDDRMRENLQLLTKRYPEYTSFVDDFVVKDILKRNRDFVAGVIRAKVAKAKEGILFINHSSGGGTKVYQDKLVDEWKKEKRIYTFELQLDYKTVVLNDYTVEGGKKFYFDFIDFDEHMFKNCLEAFGINLVYINQFITYQLEKIMQFIKVAKVEYIFFIHDFYAVCPRYTLLNERNDYCQAEKDEKICNDCLRKSGDALCSNIGDWRNLFYEFLRGAKSVIAPSKCTADIVNGYYPEIDISVKEHKVASHIKQTFNMSTIHDELLTIAVVGAIGEIKGSKIVYELVDKIRDEKLPICVKIIGITNIQNTYYKSDDGIMEITGPYDNKDISVLLAKYRVSIVLIPSICFETYSYTTSEAIYSGYPVISFNIGAPAERIKRYGCGWVINEMSSSAILSLLKKLLVDKKQVLNKVYYKNEE